MDNISRRATSGALHNLEFWGGDSLRCGINAIVSTSSSLSHHAVSNGQAPTTNVARIWVLNTMNAMIKKSIQVGLRMRCDLAFWSPCFMKAKQKHKKRRYKDEIQNTPIHSIIQIHEDHSGPYSPTLERPAPFCSTLAQSRSNCNQPTAMKSSYLMQHPSNLSPSNQPYLGDTRFIVGICFNNLWKTPTARTNARVSIATL